MRTPRRSPMPRRAGQSGFVLIALIALLAMGGLYFFVSNLTPEAIEARRQAKTEAALMQAREALIGYALKYRDEEAGQGRLDRMYGYLPLPDLGSDRNINVSCTDEGCDANTFTGIAFDANNIGPTVVGRFPWRTLGTGPLRDGHGECLWLIVSSLHSRIQGLNPVLPPMNWDTLGQLDIVTADGTNALTSALAVHDRPVAIIFSPGPPLPGQDRSNPGGPDVSECGGNYNAANYLDPAVAAALAGITNYLAGTNNASGVTGDSDTSNDPDDTQKKAMLMRGKVFKLGVNYMPDGCSGADCELLANDKGLAITSEVLFGALRKSSHFRTDINSMLDRMSTCLRDEFASLNYPASDYAKIAGADSHACYGKDVDPRGYYPSYKEMIFLARPAAGANVTIDGILQTSCAGALVFAGQRSSGQSRSSATLRADFVNYLEAPNLASFTASDNSFAGAGLFARSAAGGQDAAQDIVRCIPSGASFTTVESSTLTALGIGQLAAYNAATRTLTLGQPSAESDLGAPASGLFGCAWQPEAHVTGSGLRAYFKFNIQDTGTAGDGFIFALVDGDANGVTACGAARQHMGYSGINGSTPAITYPKIGIEIDTALNYRNNATFTNPSGFDPSYIGDSPASNSYLNNGRADPSYTGGHIGIVYWGGSSDISTGLACGTGCTSPQYCSGGICYLVAEHDDNVHGRGETINTSRLPPTNPVAPAVVPAAPAGVYKLDPSLSAVPKAQDIHVRVELDRTHLADSYNSRPVRVVATSNVTASGTGQSVDGVTLANGDRVLLTGQTAGKDNGVWVVATGAWARATPEDEVADMPSGTTWIVREGTANAWTYWKLTNPTGYLLGTTALTISKATAPWVTVATSHHGLSGLAAIGSVTPVDGNWVLVTADGADNGIYTARAGAWERVQMYRGSVTMRAWVLKDSVTDAVRIGYLATTSRAMSVLDAAYTALLQDTATIYNPQAGACTGNYQCATGGHWCGLDNICYRPALRTLRPGFTNGQGTRDQQIDIENFATTWLP